MMVRSLRAQLLLLFLLIELALLIVAGGIVHRRVTRALMGEMEDELENWVHDLAAAVEERGLDDFEAELATDWLDHFGEDEDRFYQINAVDGTLLHRSASLAEDTLDFPNTWAERSRLGAEDHGLDTLDDNEVAVVRLRVAVGGGGEVIIQAATETDELRDRQADSLEYVLLLGAALLVLSIAGGVILATLSLRPVRRLTREVRAITEENLGNRVHLDGLPSELRPVASAFNEMLDRLEAAFQRERQFTADASHEMRTPVAVILSACEVALQSDRTPGEYVEALQTCRGAADRMRGTVEQLMALAHLQRGASAIRREPVNLGEMIDETVAMLEPLAKREGITLKWDSPDYPPSLRGDSERLQELVVNLVSNAILHNRPGGKATITLARDRDLDSIRITVEDDGPGIPPEHLPKIFERFHRVDPARSRERGGGGLGLSIAQAIAEAHGGHIVCFSQEGQGARFTVHLPQR